MNKSNSRLCLMDIMKIVFALFVFLRHSATMGNCKYLLFDVRYLKSINNTVMTGFFIISGFLLYHHYHQKNLMDMKNTLSFYKKRAISIMPIYLLVIVGHFLLLDRNVSLNLGLFPIEITGIHTFFNGTFKVLHNGITWFVSCIILCYFIYPLIQEIIKYISKKRKIIIFILLLIFLSYTPFMFTKYNITDTYSNPLFRSMEFILGMLFCSILDFNFDRINNIINLLLYIISFGLLFLISYYSSLTFLKYLVIIIIVFFAANYKSNPNRKYRIINYLVTISYPFYIMQNFIWRNSKTVNGAIMKIKNNELRIMVFFSVLVIISTIAIYFYQKPLSKLLNKKE